MNNHVLSPCPPHLQSRGGRGEGQELRLQIL